MPGLLYDLLSEKITSGEIASVEALRRFDHRPYFRKAFIDYVRVQPTA